MCCAALGMPGHQYATIYGGGQSGQLVAWLDTAMAGDSATTPSRALGAAVGGEPVSHVCGMDQRIGLGPVGFEPTTKGFTLPRRFRREWTISSPVHKACACGCGTLQPVMKGARALR